MKAILINEIYQEMPNAQALGAFNRALSTKSINKVRSSMNEGNTIINGQNMLPKSKRKSDAEIKSIRTRVNAQKAAIKRMES